MRQTIDVRIAERDARVLNANSRPHWRRRAESTKAVRLIARHAAARMYPVLDTRPAVVDVHVWKARGGRYDPANLAPAAKAVVDGLVDAGVFVDDDYRHVEGPHMHHGGVNAALAGRGRGGGHVVLTVTVRDQEGARNAGEVPL